MSAIQPKVSVCVPIYNTAHCLEKCLDTLIHQTLKDIEIILVNDASTDHSEKIVEAYLKKDARIKYIKHDHNRGLSRARESAIKVASGEYISFVDSDDWVKLDMLEVAYTKAQEVAADVVAFGFYFVKPSLNEDKSPTIYRNHLHPPNLLLPLGINPAFWNKLWKRTLFQKDDIHFVDFFMGEDLVVTPKLLFYAKKIIYIENCLYYYWSPEKTYHINIIQEIKQVYPILIDFFQSKQLLDQYQHSLKKHLKSGLAYTSKLIMRGNLFNFFFIFKFYKLMTTGDVRISRIDAIMIILRNYLIRKNY